MKTTNKKISFQKAKQRFVEQGRKDIVLCEDEYTSWTNKSKFYDKIEKDYFYARPKSVYTQKSGHPNRTSKKRKDTNLKRYGFEVVTKSPKIKKKISETHTNKTDEEKRKTKNRRTKTNCKLYGVENAMQSTEKKKKYENTCLKKHGFKNVSQVLSVKNKKRKTMLKKYGVEYTFKSEKIQKKIKETCIKKYGKDNPFVKYRIKETGELLKEWLNKQTDPKPAYSTIQSWLQKSNLNYEENDISLDFVKVFLKNYRTNKSTLEMRVENLFCVEHFNKKINDNIKYRPDFKISEKVYLNADGLYWHSEKQKEKYYHFNLRKEFDNKGYKLFQFYDNEIITKSKIVKSIVYNFLKKNKNKLKASDCNISFVNEKSAKDFLSQNDLKGSVKARHLGLYNNDFLVAILSYKQKNNVCKIERYCPIINICIENGFAKLLSYLEKNCLDKEVAEIQKWIDLRYENDDLFLENDFKPFKEIVKYKWTNGIKTICKAKNSQKNWYKIYDAGQRLYIKQLKRV